MGRSRRFLDAQAQKLDTGSSSSRRGNYFLRAEKCQREIAVQMERSGSTISREIEQNNSAGSETAYSPDTAVIASLLKCKEVEY